MIAAPVLILVTFALHSLLWVAIVAVVLMLLAAGTGRAALRTDAAPAGMQAVPAARPQHPFLIMNPRSGGGKVTKFRLKEKAEALGAEVALLEGPGMVDVAALARQAVADGADLLGVAGGDGTQALVAASPPSTACRSWSSARAPATTSPSTWDWTGTTRPPASMR